MAIQPLHRRILDSDTAVALFAPMAVGDFEVVAFAYLDPKWMLLGMRHISGAHDWIAPPIRMVAGDALAFGATGIVMAHNHPSGDPTPSAADLDFTQKLASALGTLGIRLFDHFIIAATKSISLRGLGQL